MNEFIYCREVRCSKTKSIYCIQEIDVKVLLVLQQMFFQGSSKYASHWMMRAYLLNLHRYMIFSKRKVSTTNGMNSES